MNLGIHDFGLFLASALLLNLTPGQDTLYIVGRTLAQGRAHGVAAALGVSVGTAVHSLAAALGVSAVVATSDLAYTVMKLVGAAYLVYLGVGLLLDAGSAPAREDASVSEAPGRAFRRGVVTNVTNPKVALFFLAFLPQFVDAGSPQRLTALLVLGLTFVATSSAWCLVLVACAERIRRALSPSGKVASGISRAAGLLFVLLGLRLGLGER